MSAHSSIVGGSNAERLLACPGSHSAIRALPAQVETTSPYAEEGTFAHAVMDALMRVRQAGEVDIYRAAHDLLGATFHDRELTQAHLETLILPALAALADLEAQYEDVDGPFQVVGVEAKVKFPGIPAAFGTCDLILKSARHVLHIDWKFGQGVGVRAVYTDEQGERVNAQLMFYLTSAMASFPRQYAGRRKLVVAIVQPRSLEPLTHTVVSRREVRFFREDLVAAAAIALSQDPPRTRGEHCRFAPCKVACPLWTGPMLDLSGLPPVERPADVSRRDTSPAYGEYLARAKALVDNLALLKTEIDGQLHAYLENGGEVPGWRLKHKVKQRRWIDDTARVGAELAAFGLADEDIWQTKLQTFAVVDAAAKRCGFTVPNDLRFTPPSDETTLATTDDPAPVVERKILIEQFCAALQNLKQATGN